MLKQGLKRLLFGSGTRPRAVWFGPGRGCRYMMNPAEQSQRILGLSEAEISRDFARFARRCHSFIDIGSSDGHYLVMVGKLNPQAALIGYEPWPELIARGAENLKLNSLTGTCVNRFVGNAADCVTLDSIGLDCAPPVFVKIDVEGVEVEVLKSGLGLLARGCLLVIEVHSASLEKDCMLLLAQYGYQCKAVKKAWWRALVPENRPTEFNQWLIAEPTATP